MEKLRLTQKISFLFFSSFPRQPRTEKKTFSPSGNQHVEARRVHRRRRQSHRAEHPRSDGVVPSRALRQRAEDARPDEPARHRDHREQRVAERALRAGRAHERRRDRHDDAVAGEAHGPGDEGGEGAGAGAAAFFALFFLLFMFQTR